MCPRDASRDHLPEKDGFPWPEGYPHDAGDTWLKAIEFGKIIDKQKEENVQQNQKAKEFGFDSVDEANTMAEIAKYLERAGEITGGIAQKNLLPKSVVRNCLL